jgi:hypothetical protein
VPGIASTICEQSTAKRAAAGQQDDGSDEARSAYEYAMTLMSSFLQMAITKQIMSLIGKGEGIQ